MTTVNKNVLGREGTEAQLRTRLSAGQLGKATDNNKLIHKSRVLDGGQNIVTSYLSETETLALINGAPGGSIYWKDVVTNMVDLPLGEAAGTVIQVISERALYTMNTSNQWVPLGNLSAVLSESTGVRDGGVLSAGAGASEFSITDGTGQVVTNLGVIVEVSWSGLINLTPTDIGTTARTYIAIDGDGLLIQSSIDFTVAQSRTLIILGIVVHLDNINVVAVNNQQHIAYNAMSSLYDLSEAIGVFNISGNVFSGNGVNLSLDKSVGSVFRGGVNYANDVNNPHEKTLALLTALTFTYVYNNDVTGTTGTLLDPSNLDDGAGGLTALSNNTKWSVQRIYSFSSNIVGIQRGVSEFNSLDDAINGINGEPFFTASSIKPNALLRGWLIVKKNATDLTDISQAQFIEAPKFGEGGGSAGGSASLVDLQTAYNNSIDPEIVTDTTNGAVTLKRGSALDTDNVLEIQNGAGSAVWEVTGEGDVTAHQIDVVHTATATDDHSIEIDSNANGFGDVKALDIDYITGAIATGDDEAVVLINIDQSLSTGGDIVALEVLTTEGGAKATALLTGAEVGVIEQLSGVFIDMTSALVNAVDELANLINGGINTSIFVADNDTMTIGDVNKFEEIEFLLSTFASKNIEPIFEYSTGVGTWAAFTPIDGTNGMKNTGLIAWIDADIPTWAVGTGSEYLIRITRTRNGVATTPIASKVQIAETTEFFWDKDGNVKINELEGLGDATFGGIVNASRGYFQDAINNNFPLRVIEAPSATSTNIFMQGDGELGLLGVRANSTRRFNFRSETTTDSNFLLRLYDSAGLNSKVMFSTDYATNTFETAATFKATDKIIQGAITDTGEGIICESLKSEGVITNGSFTTTEKNALSVVAGTQVFDSTLAKMCFYNGTAWETITSV
jgi:hypothetical protein